MNEQERAEMTDVEKKEPGKKSVFGRIFRVMAIAAVILLKGSLLTACPLAFLSLLRSP